MRCKQNKSINTDKEESIREICALLENLNERYIGIVKNFVRGLL